MDLESNSITFKAPLENDQDVQDATDLAAMGHAQALTRKFDTWSMLALAFCVLGTCLMIEPRKNRVKGILSRVIIKHLALILSSD